MLAPYHQACPAMANHPHMRQRKTPRTPLDGNVVTGTDKHQSDKYHSAQPVPALPFKDEEGNQAPEGTSPLTS